MDEDDLEEIICYTFIRGVDGPGALLRMGGYPDTVAVRTAADMDELAGSFEDGYPTMAAAVPLDGWTVVIEPEGFEGSDTTLLCAVSRGTEAVSVLRHAYASDRFGYAVDGTLVCGFDPRYPARRHGADPDRLLDLLTEVGLLADEDDGYLDDGVIRALHLVGRITGVELPPDPFGTERLSARIEPWFASPASYGDLVRPSLAPHSAELAEAAEAAAPDVQRAVAVAEVRRQAAALALDSTPGLAAALDAAARGEGAPVPVESPLGEHVRMWLATGHRASVSLNGPHRHRMTDDERRAAYALGWFTSALRGVLDPDPRVAVLAALRPLTSGLAVFGGAAARAEVVAALRVIRS